MEKLLIQKKFKSLFEKIVEPNYVINSYYTDGLINKLSATCADPEISFLDSIPLISDLISDAVFRTEGGHVSVKVFITRILALASVNELHFSKIFSKCGDKLGKDFKDISSSNMNPSLRVAYMEVALSLVGHDSGISWLLEKGVWKEILSLCYAKHTVFVVRKTYEFASKFVWKLNDSLVDTNIRMVMSYIFTPLNQYDFLKVHSMTGDVEDEICKTMEPMLQILLSIVSVVEKIEKPSILIHILTKDFNMTSHLYITFDRMRREDITLLVTKTLFWLVLAKVLLQKPLGPNVYYNAEDFMDVSVMYFNTIQYLIKRRCATLMLDFCHSCNLIWTRLWGNKSVHFDRAEQKIKIQNQLLFLCLVPVLVYVKRGNSHMSCLTNKKLEDYIVKLLNFTCEHTARAAYSLRDLSMELDPLNIVWQSVRRLTCLKHHLSNEQANLVFQALFYLLKDYDPTDDHGDLKPEIFDDSQEKDLVMTYVMDIVLCLVKNCDINWHESLEVICLYNVVYNILRRPNLSCKFVVIALSVIAMTVKKFLHPNLSLLMESKPGSLMHEIGKLIYMKMHDMNWEVRDSALELLHVCTEICYIKFPPFQKQILENKLINVSAALAFNDFEFYVQASALKCIGAASKVAVLWEQLKTEYPNILDQLISILRNNQEGIVRKEACSVLCEIYQNVKLTPAFKSNLYEHMVSSALSDFHWEVQLNALKFWKIVIQSLQSDQGMLDGTFPPVTFSKESRKIVSLNEAEIQKRLLKILDELAYNGCLTVLVKLLHEDTEVEIMEASLSICTHILDILQQYKMPELMVPKECEIRTIEDVTCNIKEESDEFDIEYMVESETSERSDNVIEGILKTDDINLLAGLYDRHMNIQSKKVEEISVQPKIKLIKFVNPYLFVRHLKSKDFQAIVDEKKRWKIGIRSISSLLDDVLGTYEAKDEVNNLDCY